MADSAPTASAAAPASPAPSAPSSTPASSAPVGGGGPSPSKSATPATPHGVNPGVMDQKAPSGTEAARKARQLSIKVDGQVENIDIDSMDDASLTKQLQLARAASKRMQEAAEIKKQQEAFRERLKKNPVEALKDPEFGLDVRKMIEEQILREYEEQQMAEPERKAKQMERALAEREAQIAQKEAEYQERETAALNERVFNETKAQFETALSTSGLPNNPHTIAMMAEVAQQNLEAGIELDPSQLAAEVRERLSQTNAHVFKGMQGEQLAKYLGDSVITEVLKYAVERVKAQQNQAGYQAPKPVEGGPDVFNPKATPNEKRKEMHDARKFWRKGGI